jgi:GMP synthase (glutamine-hydrolysing)
MKKLCILKLGSTYETLKIQSGDFEDWIVSVLDIPRDEIEIVDPGSGVPIDIEKYGGFISTGSHSMLSEEGEYAEYLSGIVSRILDFNIPYFGICYGHQLLAKAAGCQIGFNPNGLEAGIVDIITTPEAKKDNLFGLLPGVFQAFAIHSHTILNPSSKIMRLAYNEFENHHAIRVGENAWGVQFHPEFTPFIMGEYLRQENAPAKLSQIYENNSTEISSLTLKIFVKNIIKPYNLSKIH